MPDISLPARSMPSFRAIWPFSNIRHGEGRTVACLSGYAFLLLVCYYILKTLREPLLLEDGSAELKSYANATIAASLVLIVPLYGVLFRHTRRRQLLQWITVLLVLHLAVLALIGRAGTDIGFVYYVWVGLFGLVMLAQFWGHAAHVLSVEAGQRLFPVIMVGATLGGLVGPLLQGSLYAALGPWNLMWIVVVLLIASCPLIGALRRLDSRAATGSTPAEPATRRNLLGGFALVLRDRYLLLLAAMAVLLNCVNTTGEYMLAELVLRSVEDRVANGSAVSADGLISDFYSRYYLAVNVLTVVLQVLIVGRVFRWIGIHGALLVLPVVALLGYGLIAFLPIFSVISVIKILENSVDYSLTNTSRQALYLPLADSQKYQGKTAIDTFFWRLGDVVQAGVVFVGLNWLGFGFQDFAVLNIVLACVWFALALQIGGTYARRTGSPNLPRWRGWGAGITATAVCLLLVLPATAAEAAEPDVQQSARGRLFATERPLELEILMDPRELCHEPERSGCEDVEAVLGYQDASGRARTVRARLRTRGRVHTAGCSLPALFVFFDQETASGTLFEAESMLPLTTHCTSSSFAEQYLLKEYLAYRIYNLLTPASLRVRLARITYRDSRKPDKTVTRYGFFTEHFDSLAARLDGEVWEPERFDPLETEPDVLGTFELFQYLIGNTDWSVIYRHNVLLVRRHGASPIPVPYDFDFSGIVAANYAVPPPNLDLRTVRSRLYRGFCRDDSNWTPVIDRFIEQRTAIGDLADALPALTGGHRKRFDRYLADFFVIASTSDELVEEFAEACRSTGLD